MPTGVHGTFAIDRRPASSFFPPGCICEITPTPFKPSPQNSCAFLIKPDKKAERWSPVGPFVFAPLHACQGLSLEANETEDDLADLRSSPAPKSGSRGRLMAKQASRSVQDLLDTVVTPNTR